ncbi:MAG TPA: hypothetical protein VHD84_02250 [Candidatus Saccharimonadales bacterium]|nr:hypothetical protein [Candidatus Saccharimonadales bacterium]
MAVNEKISRSADYISPDERYMPRIPKEAAAFICEELGYRIAIDLGEEVKIEPLQDGVLRYPPVQVQVPRRPDYIERYVSMEPSDWSSLLPSSET